MTPISTTRLTAAVAGVAPIDGVSVSGTTARVIYKASATPQQIAAGDAVVAGFNWTAAADATWTAQQAKATAAKDADDGDLQIGTAQQRQVVAIVGIVLDEFNLHAAKINSILTAIDASTSFADLKTRIAAIVDYPTRTKAQLVTALKAKIAATLE